MIRGRKQGRNKKGTGKREETREGKEEIRDKARKKGIR
jgi:hypothetical protein